MAGEGITFVEQAEALRQQQAFMFRIAPGQQNNPADKMLEHSDTNRLVTSELQGQILMCLQTMEVCMAANGAGEHWSFLAEIREAFEKIQGSMGAPMDKRRQFLEALGKINQQQHAEYNKWTGFKQQS